MSEPKTPDEQPTEQHQRPVAGPDAHQEQPTAAEPTAPQPPVQPAAEPPTVAAEQPQQPVAEDPQTAAFAADAPGQPQAAYAPPPGAPQPQVIYVQRPPGKFANFARNRITQVVAALVVGLIVGGGIGGIIGAHHVGGPGIHRQYQYGPNGPQRGFGRGGPQQGGAQPVQPGAGGTQQG